jgi:hypothetical protein
MRAPLLLNARRARCTIPSGGRMGVLLWSTFVTNWPGGMNW